MNNKGFVFLETIIVTVALTTTLIFLYSNFNKTISDEKRRMYYDDIAYMYKTLFIRQALIKHLDEDVFNKAVNNSNNVNSSTNNLDKSYIFLFNSESKYCMNYVSGKCEPSDYKSLFKDNSYIGKLHDIYNFKMLMYLKTDDINNIKKCINGLDKDVDGYDTEKCKNYKLYTAKYSDSNLDEFMLTLNKEDSKYKTINADGDEIDAYAGHILVALFYEKKDGTPLSTLVRGGYKSCLYQKISAAGSTIEEYNKQDAISYNMACENAYYLSWVYYD